MSGDGRHTVWVLGDQLNRRLGALGEAEPDGTRVLMIESRGLLEGRRWHRQRLHLVLTAMRRLAAELEGAGFEVDYRRAESLASGLRAHRRTHDPERVVATEPLSFARREQLAKLGVELVRHDGFLCHPEDFAAWAADRKSLRLEDFYRWQRQRLGYLMNDDGTPAGGRWNYDAENREPAPENADWPEPQTSRLDDVDREVLAGLPASAFGADPEGSWATSRRAALARLRHFVDAVLPGFGPHQDAITERSWSLSHALLSPSLNLGLLHPREVCDAAHEAWREGRVPLASAEGFLRQVIGWREYVWGLYWLWMPEYRSVNGLGAERPLPPAFTDPEKTRMRCLRSALEGVEQRGWLHHIQRLMVIGNLGLTAGVRPQELADWMQVSFVDGAEWVMLPNVLGMALYADGGRMSSKPYAAGGAYLSRMSDHCRGCVFDPKQRVGDEACPFTTLYWDFLARHREQLARNGRLRNAMAGLRRRDDLESVRERAIEVLQLLDEGEL